MWGSSLRHSTVLAEEGPHCGSKEPANPAGCKGYASGNRCCSEVQPDFRHVSWFSPYAKVGPPCHERDIERIRASIDNP